MRNHDPGPGAETLNVPTAQAAVLTMMRLFRAMERVDTPSWSRAG